MSDLPRIWRRTALIALFIAFVPVTPALAQATPGPDSADVLPAARRWLTMLDSGRYAESLDSAAAFLRQMAGTTEAWQSLVLRARTDFPAKPSRTVAEFDRAPEVPGAPPGRYVRITFRVQTGKGVVDEVVVLQAGDRGWRVAMYGTGPG